jgi:S1-C subfamily serine protease
LIGSSRKSHDGLKVNCDLILILNHTPATKGHAMKTLLAGALALASVSTGAAVYVHIPVHTPSLQAEVLNATVRVEVRSGQGALMGSGSGTALDGRHIITNQHVIAALSEKGTLQVRGWIREGERVLPVIYEAEVIASDNAKDLALLRIDGAWIGATVPLAPHEPEEGERVCKGGAALGKRPMVTCGLSGGVDSHTLGGMRHFIHSSPTVSGDSGGGVHAIIDGKWQMIAVTRAMGVMSIGFGGVPVSTMAMAVPLEDVRAFIKGALHANASVD